MIHIAPPLVFTLMYRGVSRGVVRMQPAALPPVIEMISSPGVVVLSGWLEPNADYAEVREELSAKTQEILGWSEPESEMIDERFRYWHQFYASNGLGLLEEDGTPLPCESIDVSDSVVHHELDPEPPHVMVSATLRQPADSAASETDA